MKWKHPSITKIYEALGAVADDRVLVSGNSAKVYSSSRNKFYNVNYDAVSGQILSNDNSSYWKGELGYPSIAFLMKTRILAYDADIANILKGVPWKDINQKFKNNFEKALEFILSTKTQKERNDLRILCEKVDVEIKKLNLGLLGEKVTPPDGY